MLNRGLLPFQASVPRNTVLAPIPFYGNAREGTSQDRGVERRIDEEGAGGEGGRNEPPGDQTWIRNEKLIRAFLISKSTGAQKEADGPLLNAPMNKHVHKRQKNAKKPRRRRRY